MQDLMPPINTQDSIFHDGDPTTGQLGTIVTALWLNNVQAATRDVQAEIKNVLAKAGMTPDPKKNNQLADAISQIVSSGNYASTAYVDNGLNKKIDKANISGAKGNDNDKVPSLNLFTTETGKLATKAELSSGLASKQPTGDYVTTQTLNDGLNKKFDKTGGVVNKDNEAITLKNNTEKQALFLGFRRANNDLRGYVGAPSDTNNDIALVNWSTRKSLILKEDGQLTYGGTKVLLAGDGGWMKDTGISLSGYPKLSDYRINSIGYAYANISQDSFRNRHNVLLNLFGYTTNAYGVQLAATLDGSLGFRCILNDAVDDWIETYTNRNALTDRNGCLRKAGSSEELSDYPVGSPIPWTQATAPSGFLVCNGQSFNKTTYPLLAKAYPSGVLPDLRGEFIRGLDSGRGVDSGRGALTSQLDQMQRITGQTTVGAVYTDSSSINGAFTLQGEGSSENYAADLRRYKSGIVKFDSGSSPSARVSSTTSGETRPRNIAFLYIVRAA